MKTDLLTNRHNGIQESDLPVMLEKIGVESLDELINKTIPANIRLKEPLPLSFGFLVPKSTKVLIASSSAVCTLFTKLLR